MVASFIVLELGVGVSQTISNDIIVASVPTAKAGAASAVSEPRTSWARWWAPRRWGRSSHVLPVQHHADRWSPRSQAADARESIAGAISVARTLPDPAGAQLLESARLAFDSGIAPTATIAATLTLVAAVIVAVAFRSNKVPTGQR